MDTSKDETLDAERVLYDSECLGRLRDQYGNAFEIKANVDTTAKVYEIRTAIRCWFGGHMDYRTSDRIETNIDAFKDGERKLGVAPDGSIKVMPA
jgi:hypothetical protein